MNFNYISTEKELHSLLNNLPPVISLDTETTDLNPRKAQLLSVVIATNSETAYSIPAKYIGLLCPLQHVKLVFLQNFKYDYKILHYSGLDMTDVPFRDSMLLHHLIDENQEHGLDYMVKQAYNDNYKEVFWSKYKTIEEADPQDRLEYECKDAIYTYRLCKEFLTKLKGKESLIQHAHRLAKALYLTELRGVRVNRAEIALKRDETRAKLEGYLPLLRSLFIEHCSTWELTQLSDKIKSLKSVSGKQKAIRPTFNFGSDAQLKWLLYDSLKLPITTKTKKGNPSTDYETIEKLALEFPQLEPLKEYKGIKSLYATFIEGMLDKVENDHIYPEFNVNGTLTGRISHSNPNLGNIPKDGGIREFFIPAPGYKLIGADYEGLEVGIEANFTKDKMLLEIMLNCASKHDITAQSLKIDRQTAKNVNFAMQYRCGVHKLSKMLSCSYKEAEYQWNKYWETYSGVKGLMDKVDKMLTSGESIINPFGRVRHMPSEYRNEYELARAQRQAYNSLIQGTGADMTHMAFYRMSEELELTGHGRMLWEVHDELLAEVKEDRVQGELNQLVTHMQGVSQQINFHYIIKAKPYGPLDAWTKT